MAPTTVGTVMPEATAVQVVLRDGNVLHAQLADGWYIAWSEPTKTKVYSVDRVVATTPSGSATYTPPPDPTQ